MRVNLLLILSDYYLKGQFESSGHKKEPKIDRTRKIKIYIKKITTYISVIYYEKKYILT